MGDCQILSSASKITPAYTHITELANRILYTMKKLTVHHIHHLPKCLSCLTAILVITGQWLHMCLIFILLLRDLCTLCDVHLYVYVYVDVDVIYNYLCPVCFLSPHNQEGTLFSMITYVLYPSRFCKISALCVSWKYLNLSYDLCNLSRCLISRRRSSIVQTLIKIKNKVKRMVKVVKARNSHPSSYVQSFLSTTKHLEKIWLHMVFTLFDNILKMFFEQTKI